MTTPTLNRTYNEVLRQWAEDGHDATPECEECGQDMTGQRVYETQIDWLCEPCFVKQTWHD